MRRPRLKLIHKSAVYHILSRITQQQQWLGLVERAYLMQLLRRVAQYCGVEVITFCILSDHFNLLIRVPEKAPADAAINGGELIRRVEILYGIEEANDLRAVWNARETPEMAAEWDSLLALHLGRMHDLSVFMKVLKQRFTIWHNAQHETLGTLWTERFASLLVEAREEGNDALSMVAAFIEMAPVRSGAVQDASEYPFSGRWFASQRDVHGGEMMSLQDPALSLGSDWIRGVALGTVDFVGEATDQIAELAARAKRAFLVSPAMHLYTGLRFRRANPNV
jgi:putative transposase